MAIKLPRLPGNWADQKGLMERYWDQAMTQIEYTLNQILAIPVIQQALASVATATQAAMTAANNANAAATTATTAATAATATSKLTTSYISPASVLSATPTVINIAAHTRYYSDGTSVSVNAGSVAATAAGDTDYVSYSDPNLAGGAVSYVVSTTNPAQTNGIHVVGAVMIPTTGTASGGKGPSRPGTVLPQ